MRGLIDALYSMGSCITEDLATLDAQVRAEHLAEPFKVRPATLRAILDLLAAIEEEYPHE